MRRAPALSDDSGRFGHGRNRIMVKESRQNKKEGGLGDKSGNLSFVGGCKVKSDMTDVSERSHDKN